MSLFFSEVHRSWLKMAQKLFVLVQKWSLDGTGRDGKMFVIITIFTYCLVIVLSVAWMGVLLCGPRVPRGRICISLYSNQGYQGGEGDGGSFIKLGEVIAMKISLK